MTGFSLPDKVKNDVGEIRHVGYELEYSGIDLEHSVAILQKFFQGEPVADGAFYYAIEDKKRGTFSVEIDAALLRDGKYREYLAVFGIQLEEFSYEKELDDLLSDIASTVVPCEIVTPPLPMDDMDIIDEIVVELRKAKAEGTKASFLYAFGLHINPEIVSENAAYLLNHIRSFILLYDWICTESKVDFTRKLTPYINPYPEKFIKHTMEENYNPDITELIDDYLEMVGSRNQALDMLPVFANIDKKRVISKAKEPDLIKPRPAFHYRLANCLIDKEDWTVSDEWQYWLKIEELANNKDTLNQMCRSYLEHLNQSIIPDKTTWVKHVAEFFH